MSRKLISGSWVDVAILDGLYTANKLTAYQRERILCGADPSTYGLSPYDLAALMCGRTVASTSGLDAFTVTTAGYIQPPVGSAVMVNVASAAFAAVGQVLYVALGGYYRVGSRPTPTSLSLINLGYLGSAAVGDAVVGGAGVSPGGLMGPSGASGVSAFTATTAPYVQPPVGNSVTVQVGTSSLAAVGQVLFAVSGGHYQVASVPTPNSLSLTNLGYTGSAAPATIVPSGVMISPGGVSGPAGPAPTGSGNVILASPADGSAGVAVLRGLVLGDSPPLSVVSFTVSGVWTKPAGARLVRVICIGGGGGGGSGRRATTSAGPYGGSGGSGGAMSDQTFLASQLPASVAASVSGGGGAGAAAQTVDSTDGIAGSAGAASSFGVFLQAGGGFGGSGGSPSQPVVSGQAGGMFASGAGGAGGLMSPTSGGTSPYAGGSGGGGGGISNTSIAYPGAAGGVVGALGIAPGTAGSAGGGAGGNGASSFAYQPGTGGGGGGAGNATGGPGGAGGLGGLYGGGGGGGGGSVNGSASGVGGAGTGGIVLVICY